MIPELILMINLAISRPKAVIIPKVDLIVIEEKDVFVRRLANNLQNSYLKGINYLINDNLENRRDPNKFLEDYDICIWNEHIYNLSNANYQRKMFNQINLN